MRSEIVLRPGALGSWVRRIRSNCYAFSPVLVGVLLLHGGFFFRAGSPFEQHFLAFTGVRELHIALCCFAAVLVVLEGLRRKEFLSGDLILIGVVVAYALGSAALANLEFGQPILYGLFEERRVFVIWGVFLILAAYHQANQRPEALIGALNWTALIYLVLGLTMQTGVLGDLAARDIPVFDPRKYRILVGTDIYAAAVIVGMVMIIRFKEWKHLIPVLIGVAGLILISQTRSAMVVVGAAVVAYFIITAFIITAFWRFLITTCAAAGAAAFFIFSHQGGLVAELNVRVHTANTIFSELGKNDWIGMGALSLQWQNGFHRVYDRFFYLSDVGVVGELYRFGLFLPVIYAGLALAIFCYFRQPIDPRGRSIAFGMLLLFIINSPGGGLIAFAGTNLALMLAFATAFRASDAVPGTLDTRLAIRV